MQPRHSAERAKQGNCCCFNVMRIITGYLQAAPIEYLPVLENISLPVLRREELTCKLVNKAVAFENHIFHNCITPSRKFPPKTTSAFSKILYPRNLIAPFCCVRGKDTLRHLPLQAVLNYNYISVN